MACPSKPSVTQCPSTPAGSQCPSTPAGSQCPGSPAGNQCPCTIFYNLNGSTDGISGIFKPQTVNYGSSYTIANTPFPPSGYIFKHWTTGSGAIYSSKATFTVYSNVTLTAQWQANLNMFLSQFDLTVLKYKTNSEIKGTNIRTNCAKYAVGIEIPKDTYYKIMALMYNEHSFSKEEQLAVASTVVNNYEANKNLGWENFLYSQCIQWASESAKIKMADNVKNMSSLVETNHAFIAIKEMLDWTLQGNRIFDQSIRFWAGDGTNNYFSTDWH